MIERKNETLWVEKYRPRTLDDCILPKKTKEDLRAFIEKGEIPNLIFHSRVSGVGKAQPLTSKLLTPNGWVTMGDAYVGMPIINGNGNETKITGVYPQGVRDTYRITFNDRTSIEVSDEHLNAVCMLGSNGTDKEFVVTTKDLIKMHKKYGHKIKVRVPRINFEKKELALDPYFVGLMIGDGSLSGNFGFSNSEDDIVNAIESYVSGYGCTIRQISLKAPCDYRIVLGDQRYCVNNLKHIMENYGMMCKSVEKRIPKEYLFSSYEDRLELLRGLFDTDGSIGVQYIHKNGKEYRSISYEFDTSSKGLSEDFAFLARSLGIVDTVSVRMAGYRDRDGNFIKCNDSYRHCLKVPKGLKIFKSVKHTNRWKERMYNPVRSIVSIEYIGRKECQCIMVESDDHCYITDNVTVTHNTTLARVLGEQMGMDVLFINASLENGIDVLRNKIATFASTVSLVASKKCVILDEADNLSQSMQPALRGFIEQFSANVRFIFTCNYVNKLLPAILSRCAVIDFNIPAGERQELMKESLRRVEYILKAEGKEYDRKAVAKVLKLHFPDLRRTINDLARYSGNGRIDEDILINMSHNNFSLLIKHLRERNFKELRLWVANNKDIEPSAIFTFFYENASKFMKPESIPQLIITTDRYQFQAAFVVDQEINVAAYLTEVMANCQFLQMNED